eukprot:511236-Lingulodinium_polyedra.AAC.1
MKRQMRANSSIRSSPNHWILFRSVKSTAGETPFRCERTQEPCEGSDDRANACRWAGAQPTWRSRHT